MFSHPKRNVFSVWTCHQYQPNKCLLFSRYFSLTAYKKLWNLHTTWCANGELIVGRCWPRARVLCTRRKVIFSSVLFISEGKSRRSRSKSQMQFISKRTLVRLDATRPTLNTNNDITVHGCRVWYSSVCSSRQTHGNLLLRYIMLQRATHDDLLPSDRLLAAENAPGSTRFETRALKLFEIDRDFYHSERRIDRYFH